MNQNQRRIKDFPKNGANSKGSGAKLFEFFLNFFIEFGDKIFVITVKGFEPATTCVRDQDAATVPARQMWETGSLNWAPSHASVIYQIPWIRWIHWISVPFTENSNISPISGDH